ncbi:MAG TPA: hypothetical protein VFG54_16195 [Prolixibacteraceae bacterium]|nr:hypothetical protein [Prolixibacteraceae bacterium]
MAEVNDIYGKDLTGKVGLVSFYRLNGKTIMRSLPVKRSKTRSKNQVRNQNRFKEVQKFCKQFKLILIPQIWNGAATTSSGYHLFMKTNTPAFDKDGILTDPLKIRLSAGTLTMPTGMQAGRTSAGGTTIRINWDKEPGLGSSTLKDRLMVVSAGEGNYSDISGTGLIRNDLGGTFELPELASTATHLYLFFESLDQRYYSESVCVEI